MCVLAHAIHLLVRALVPYWALETWGRTALTQRILWEVTFTLLVSICKIIMYFIIVEVSDASQVPGSINGKLKKFPLEWDLLVLKSTSGRI